MDGIIGSITTTAFIFIDRAAAKTKALAFTGFWHTVLGVGVDKTRIDGVTAKIPLLVTGRYPTVTVNSLNFAIPDQDGRTGQGFTRFGLHGGIGQRNQIRCFIADPKLRCSLSRDTGCTIAAE